MRKTGRTRGTKRDVTYEITCTRCNGRVLVVDGEWILLVGRRPVELSTGLEGDVLVTCNSCGTLVPIDENLVVLR
jgi:hypothetical protein